MDDSSQSTSNYSYSSNHTLCSFSYTPSTPNLSRRSNLTWCVFIFFSFCLAFFFYVFFCYVFVHRCCFLFYFSHQSFFVFVFFFFLSTHFCGEQVFFSFPFVPIGVIIPNVLILFHGWQCIMVKISTASVLCVM